jgi:GTP-binding protein HflX
VADLSHPQYEDQIKVVNNILQEMKAYDKPVITIFNKVDQYDKNTFDEWLAPEIKAQLMQELLDRWNNETNYNAIFISATEKLNIEELRTVILDKVKELYAIRYPYKSNFY